MVLLEDRMQFSGVCGCSSLGSRVRSGVCGAALWCGAVGTAGWALATELLCTANAASFPRVFVGAKSRA